MKLTGKQIGMIVVAGLAGIFLAVWLFRTRYGRQILKPIAKLESALTGTPTPAMAQPRYLGFGGGEYYDPFSIWPYGNSSNYLGALATNSGVPTTQLPSTAGSLLTPNNVATGISGNGLGGGMGGPNGFALGNAMRMNGGGGSGR